MVCKKCNGLDHNRSSSSKCIYNSPRISSLIPVSSENGKYTHTDFGFTIKYNLRKITLHEEIYETIDTLSKTLTVISYNASRLLNLHILRCLESDISFNLNETFIRKFFTIVSKENGNFDKFDKDILETYKLFPQYVDKKYKIMPPGFSQIVTIAVKNYKVNIDVHHDKIYWTNLRKWCKLHFFDHVETEKCIDFFIMKPSLSEISTSYPKKSFEMFHQKNIVESVYKSTMSIYKRNISVLYLKKLLLLKKGRLDKKLEHKLSQIHKTKTSTIVPLFTQKMKYITIDTNVLYSLLGGKKGTGFTLEEFASNDNQIDMWKRVFKLKESWLEYDKHDKKIFNFQVMTDGLSCSLIFKKHILRNKGMSGTVNKSIFDKRIKKRKQEIDFKKNKKKMKMRHKENTNTNTDMDVEYEYESYDYYIGIDPGTGSILTSVTMDTNSNPDKEIVKSVSNGHYQNMCLHKNTATYVKNYNKKKGIVSWISNIPTSKTMESIKFIEYLEYVSDEKNEILQEFHYKWKTRFKRWMMYVQRQKVKHKICKDIISTIPEGKKGIVAFGDGSWTQRKGYASSPLGKKFYEYMKDTFSNHMISIKSTPEFNTSQICSKCNTHSRLLPGDKEIISNPHFVKKCKTCKTMWNRDVNACRNIINVCKTTIETGVKPEIFSKRIPELGNNNMTTDICHSVTIQLCRTLSTRY